MELLHREHGLLAPEAMPPGLRATLYARVPAYLAARTGFGTEKLWNGIVFGLVPLAVLHYYVLARVAHVEAAVLFHASTYLAGSCVWIGPLLNQRWERDFETFYRELTRRAAHEGWSMAEIERVRRRYDDLLPATAAFAVLLVVAAVAGMPVLSAYATLGGWGDPMRWGILLIAAAIGYSGGVGLWGVCKTVAVAGAIARSPLAWSPYHEDGLGGLKFVSEFSLSTTLLFSAGSLAVPLSLEIAWFLDGLPRLLVGSTAFVFSLGVAASFLGPTVQISRLAAQRKTDLLREVRILIDAALAQSFEPAAPGRRAGQTRRQVEAHKLLDARVAFYERLRGTVVYPFGVATLSKLAASILAPVLLFALEIAVKRYFGL